MSVLLDKSLIYLDYNATTPLADFLQEEIQEWLYLWGNPSSIHQKGQASRTLFWNSKKQIAEFVSCHPLELVATSGGTEANNIAIKSLYASHFYKNKDKNEILISSVEHPSVKVPVEELGEKGLKVRYIPVSIDGKLDMEAYESLLSSKTFMVSVMYANNETGSIFPIKQLVEKAHQVGAFFHCDAVQALGKCLIDLHDLKVDTASFSAHKFYALKGTGLLYCRKGIWIKSFISGGPQERSRRAGTENILGMASLGSVARRGEEILKHSSDIEKMRDQIETELKRAFPYIKILGSKGKRLGNTSCMYIPKVSGETLLMNMDLKGYAFSVGSACHSGSINPSGVLLAMGMGEQKAKEVIRVSLGLGVKIEHIRSFIRDLIESIRRMKSLELKA